MTVKAQQKAKSLLPLMMFSFWFYVRFVRQLWKQICLTLSWLVSIDRCKQGFILIFTEENFIVVLKTCYLTETLQIIWQLDTPSLFLKSENFTWPGFESCTQPALKGLYGFRKRLQYNHITDITYRGMANQVYTALFPDSLWFLFISLCSVKTSSTTIFILKFVCPRISNQICSLW